MTRRRSLLLVLALVAGACSVPTDGDPVAIAPGELPPELRPSTTQAPVTTAPPQPVDIGVYLIDNTLETPKLVRVERTISGLSVTGALKSLIDEPIDEGLASAWRPAFANLTTDLSDGTLVIDFTVESEDDRDDLASLLAGRQAAAQVVFTAAEFDGIDRVRFEINGEPTTVAVSGSDAPARESVERCDYRGLIPDDDDFGTDCPPLPTTTGSSSTTSAPPTTSTTMPEQIPE